MRLRRAVLTAIIDALERGMPTAKEPEAYARALAWARAELSRRQRGEPKKKEP